ncbi:unnamed protein product [Porites lobata]|uniref:Uncharacterized protein n=1 Tax=Porites lobata TaxID=104759 RepID=A0ABN8R321_9CNID|nr:unnamed protein product [Porites lobata]
MSIQDFFTTLTVLLFIVEGKSQAIDGGYSSWSEFSECNSTCGNGVKTRARLCNNPEPSSGGKACTGLGPAVEYQACNSFPCRMRACFIRRASTVLSRLDFTTILARF